MNKSIILPSLVAALALASCGKKETYGVHSIIQQHGKIVAMLVTAGGEVKCASELAGVFPVNTDTIIHNRPNTRLPYEATSGIKGIQKGATGVGAFESKKDDIFSITVGGAKKAPVFQIGHSVTNMGVAIKLIDQEQFDTAMKVCELYTQPKKDGKR